MRRAAVIAALAALIAGCGEGDFQGDYLPGPPLTFGPAANTLYTPAGAGGIVGDWFFCESGDCAVLYNDGLRFFSNWTYVFLQAPGSNYEPGEGYCRLEASGTYTWDGYEYVLEFEYGDIVRHAAVEVHGDVATAFGFDGERLTLKRVTPDYTGPCPQW